MKITEVAICIIAAFLLSIGFWTLYAAVDHHIKLLFKRAKRLKGREHKKSSNNDSIMGKTNFKLRPKPTDNDTQRQAASESEKVTTFADDKGEQKSDAVADEELIAFEHTGIDPNQQASGVILSEVQEAVAIAAKPTPSQSERNRAGEIFFKIEGTDIAQQLTNENDAMRSKINNIIKIHRERYQREMNRAIKAKAPQSSVDFNINDYI